MIMRIVHIQDIFHPEAGYQENVLAKYQALQGYEVTVVASEIEKVPNNIIGFFGKEDMEAKDKRYGNDTGVRIIRVPVYRYVSGRAIYKNGIFKLIEQIKPDILFIHGNDTYIGMRYILKLGKLKFPVIYDNHMVDVASHNKLRKLYYFIYKSFFAKRIIRNSVTVIRTENDNFVQNRLGIPEYLSPVIQFGSDLLLFHKDEEVKRTMRRQYGISPDSFVVIYAGKLDEYKGGMLLAQAMLHKLTCSKNIEFVIVGNFVGEYGKQVKELMEGSENRVHFFPTQKYIDLPKFWQMADCAVLPKECSTTFFDAQACGLPCIAEDKISINQDRLSHGNGYCYTSNSAADFRNKICMIAEATDIEYQKMSDNSIQYVQEHYNYKKIVDEINLEIDKQIEKWRQNNR